MFGLRSNRLHGSRKLRPEALPQNDDERFRRRQSIASPSNQTEAGRKILAEDPDNKGSLGIAISEAVEDCLESEKTGKKANYTIGSVFNHVCMHQTVEGLEAKKQLEMVDDYPDAIYGCIGGGSSFSGLMWPFYYDKVSKKAPKETQFVAVEPTACPKVTKGYYTYDHGDTAKLTPLVPCTPWDMTSCQHQSTQADYATTASHQPSAYWPRETNQHRSSQPS